MANVAYLGDHHGTPIFQAVFKRHTGMVVFSQTRSAAYRGTVEQLEQAYKEAQSHNLIAGWWGVISLLVYNWIAIFSNVSTRNALRELATHVASDRARAFQSPPVAPEQGSPGF